MAIYPRDKDVYSYSTLSVQDLEEQLSTKESLSHGPFDGLVATGLVFTPGLVITAFVIDSIIYKGIVTIFVLLVVTGALKARFKMNRIAQINALLDDTSIYPTSTESWRALIVELLFAVGGSTGKALAVEEHFVSLLLVDHVNADLKSIVDNYLKHCRKMSYPNERKCRIAARKIVNDIFDIVNDDMQARSVVIKTVDHVRAIQ